MPLHNNSPAGTLSIAVCLSYSMSDRGSLVTRVLLLPLGVSTLISNSVLAVGCFMHRCHAGTATFAGRFIGSGSKTGQGEVIAAVQFFFFVSRKLSRLEQLAAALFLYLSRYSRRLFYLSRCFRDRVHAV